MVGERAWKREFLRDHIVNNILYQSLSLGYSENAICSILFDDLNSPLSLLTRTRLKKSRVFRFSFCPSALFYFTGGGKRFCLQLPLPSWCSIQCSRFGSTTVSTLVHGCEETTCYLLFADRHTERATAAITEKAFCKNIKAVHHIAPSWDCTFLVSLCNECNWFWGGGVVVIFPLLTRLMVIIVLF